MPTERLSPFSSRDSAPRATQAVTVGLRVHTKRLTGQRQKYGSGKNRITQPWTHYTRAVVFDTETTIDQFQAGLFGVAKICDLRWSDGKARLKCWREIVFYADWLPKERPDEYQIIK